MYEQRAKYHGCHATFFKSDVHPRLDSTDSGFVDCDWEYLYESKFTRGGTISR